MDHIITVAGEPADFTAMAKRSNSTHVNINVSWTAPPDPVTGYVIYYQSQRGPVLNETVTEGGETHSLNGLQKGATYNISIVALSQHLPSLLVGPVNASAGELVSFPEVIVTIIYPLTLGPEMVVETVPSLNTTVNDPFSLTCNIRAELDGHPLNTTIQWIRIFNPANTKEILNSFKCTPSDIVNEGCGYDYGSGSHFSSSLTAAHGYESVLHTTENSTNSPVIYRCQAIALNITTYSDTTVYVEGTVILSAYITLFTTDL